MLAEGLLTLGGTGGMDGGGGRSYRRVGYGQVRVRRVAGPRGSEKNPASGRAA